MATDAPLVPGPKKLLHARHIEEHADVPVVNVYYFRNVVAHGDAREGM